MQRRPISRANIAMVDKLADSENTALMEPLQDKEVSEGQVMSSS